MFLKRMILLKSFFYFDRQCHKQALPKFIILWLISTLPVIIAVLLMPRIKVKAAEEDGKLDVVLTHFFELFDAISGSFTASELFVYSAAFLAPILYLFYERVRETETNEGENFTKRAKMSMRHFFDGFWLIYILAIFVFSLTVFSYVVGKIDPDIFKDTYLYTLADSTTLYCYIFSLLCWYLSILDGIKDRCSSDYVASQREIEDDMVNDFSARLGDR